MIRIFLNEWLRIVKYCRAPDTFDRGMFSVMHDNYAKAYKKLSNAEQGEISYLISKLDED